MSELNELSGKMTLTEAETVVKKLRDDLLKAIDPILLTFMDSTPIPIENLFLALPVQMTPNDLGAETRLSAPPLIVLRCVGGQTVSVADADGIQFGLSLRANIERAGITLYGAVLQGLTRSPEPPQEPPKDTGDGNGSPEPPEST